MSHLKYSAARPLKFYSHSDILYEVLQTVCSTSTDATGKQTEAISGTF